MNDEQTNTTDTQGAEANKPLSDLDKLKMDNEAFEKELIKGREMRAEMQKIESEKMLGGTTGGHVEAETKQETAKEYADKVMKGEIKE